MSEEEAETPISVRCGFISKPLIGSPSGLPRGILQLKIHFQYLEFKQRAAESGSRWSHMALCPHLAMCAGREDGPQAPKKVRDAAVGALLLWLSRKTAEPAPWIILTLL